MEFSFAALGLVAGLLVGATGVGAGSLVTPALIAAGLPPATAVGTDLAYAAPSKGAGALAHRAQRTLDLRIASLLALGSLPAAGSTILALAQGGIETKGGLISVTLGAALVLTALALLAGRERVARFAERHEASLAPHRARLTVIAGAVLGVLVCVSSIGAGALGAVILVALYPGMPAARVAGTDIAHAVPLALVAALGHAWLGTVDFGVAAVLVAGAAPGVVAGSFLAGRLPDAVVRRLLGFVLLFAGARLALAGI
jgi:uncharacterized membrane protein YfcA